MFPAQYKPEHDQQVIDFIGSGHSLEAFAGNIGVGRTAVYAWRERHPSFGSAIEKALDLRTEFCEKLLKRIAITGKGNASTAIFLSKNWTSMRDQTQMDVTSGGATLQNSGAAVSAAIEKTAKKFEEEVKQLLLAKKPK